MRLLEILKENVHLSLSDDPEILGLSLDSRAVEQGYLYCALPGAKTHGGHFITEVIFKKPAAILVDTSYPLDTATQQALQQAHIPFGTVSDLAFKLGDIASRFYQQPSQKMDIVAVTGTNGKTSVCHYIASIMKAFKRQCAVLGTAGCGFPGELKVSDLTTPDTLTVQRLLAHYYDTGASMAALEASSHALVQHRLQGVAIKTAVFTNLSPEHFDYHLTMQAYAAAKETLFKWPNLQHAVINIDDPYGLTWCQRYYQAYRIIAYSCATTQPKLPPGVEFIQGRILEVSSLGINAEIMSPWGSHQVNIPIIGDFNLANILATLAVAQLYGMDFSETCQAIQHLQGVCGRMEVFNQKDNPTVVVDFAHTPDALAKALASVRSHTSGKLWCVFGCGGDRDRSKRPIMGKLAAQYADRIVLTNDNPRREDPAQIIAEIHHGIPKSHPSVYIEIDRTAAIKYAIDHANSVDLVLIAGKGHEMYQIIGDEKQHFSDQAVVAQCLQN